MFICFVGIDGSGKTLQAKKLVENLRARGVECHYVWCRYSPRILRPFMWIAKRRIGRKTGSSDYQGFMSSKRGILSKPGIGWLWWNVCAVEYLLQATVAVRRRLIGGKLLVCDRYVYDLIADLAVNLGSTQEHISDLTRHPAFRFLPMPDKVIFLDVPPDVAFERKDDPNVMGRQYLVDRAAIYDYLCRKLGFYRVDGTRTIEEIAQLVLEQCIELAGKADTEESR